MSQVASVYKRMFDVQKAAWRESITKALSTSTLSEEQKQAALQAHESDTTFNADANAAFHNEIASIFTKPQAMEVDAGRGRGKRPPDEDAQQLEATEKETAEAALAEAKRIREAAEAKANEAGLVG